MTIKSKFASMKIRKKLILYFLLTALFPVFLLSLFFIQYYIGTIREDAGRHTEQMLDQACSSINNFFKQVDNYSLVAFNDMTLRSYLIDSASTREEDDKEYEQILLDAKISQDINYLSYRSADIQNIILVDANGNAYYYGPSNFDYSYDFFAADWFNDIINKGGSKVILNTWRPEYLAFNNTEFVTFSRALKGRNDNKPYGVLLMDIGTNVFKTICSQIDLGETGKIIITDGELNLLFDSGGTNVFEQSDIEILHTSFDLNRPDGFTSVRTGDENYMCSVKTSPELGWRIVSIIPMTELTGEANILTGILIGAFILLAIIIIIFSIFIAGSFIKPIKRLHAMTLKVAAGDMALSPVSAVKDEIGELTHSFYNMAKDLQALLNAKQELIVEEKKMRLDYLTNQTNPHFLYNALNSTYISAVANKDEETALIIRSLSTFFRYVVKEPVVISIDKELSIVQSYVDFQLMRYDKKFDISFFVDEELRDCLILKMILQPIVENAILHGILEVDRQGHISVKIIREGKDLVLRVKDNGLGMADETLDSIRSELCNTSQITSDGWGLNHTHERLVLYFGEKYGLKIYSEYGVGSVVEVRIPYIREGDIE